MTRQSYDEIQKKISVLQVKADLALKNEAKDVIDRIKEAIKRYKLTAADLGFNDQGEFIDVQPPEKRKRGQL